MAKKDKGPFFTPCFDIIIKKYGYTTALVYGKIHRYTTMSAEGECWASQKRIGKELRMDRKTVRKHIDILLGKDEDGIIRQPAYIQLVAGADGRSTKTYKTTGMLEAEHLSIYYEETAPAGGEMTPTHLGVDSPAGGEMTPTNKEFSIQEESDNNRPTPDGVDYHHDFSSLVGTLSWIIPARLTLELTNQQEEELNALLTEHGLNKCNDLLKWMGGHVNIKSQDHALNTFKKKLPEWEFEEKPSRGGMEYATMPRALDMNTSRDGGGVHVSTFLGGEMKW